jgi:hypothetical protein
VPESRPAQAIPSDAHRTMRGAHAPCGANDTHRSDVERREHVALRRVARDAFGLRVRAARRTYNR